MSFPKAKIKRFNEQGSEGPPPGAYDPKFDNKIKGLVLEKKERFADNKSVCSSGAESIVSTTSKTSSNHIAEKINAQLLVKKRVIVKPQYMSTIKSKVHKSPKSPKVTSKNLSIHNAKYKISDLNAAIANKEKMIMEYEERVRQLEADLELHKKELESMAYEKQVLLSFNDKYKEERESLNLQLRNAEDAYNALVEYFTSYQPPILDVDLKNLNHLEEEKKKINDRNETVKKEIESRCKDSQQAEQLTNCIKSNNKFYLDCIDFVMKAIRIFGNESKLECEYYIKNNEEIRQQLEYTSILNKELLENLRNIKSDKTLLTEQLTECKKMMENQERVHQIELIKLKETVEKETKRRSKCEKKLQELENMYITREKELNEVKKSMSIKVVEVKKHADKMIKNAEAVTRETLAACRNESEEKVKKIIAETDSKMSVMKEEARMSVNEEMRSATDKYEALLKKYETEKESLEHKLSEKDTEINWLNTALEELKTTAETQESFSQSLQAELDRVETELAEKKEELRALKDKIRTESAEMVDRRRRFDVVMAENQASINALMQRLAQSDAEIEKLQRELKNGEVCMHEHRDLLNVMRNKTKLANEQIFVLMDQIVSKGNLIDQIEKDNIADIESMKASFEQKVESLKEIIANEIETLKKEGQRKQMQNKELKHQLEKMSEKMKDAQELLLKLEERNDEKEIEISKLQLEKSKLEKTIKEREEICDSHEVMIMNQYEDKIIHASKKINNLAKALDNMQESITTLQNEYAALESQKVTFEKNEHVLKENLDREINQRLKLEEHIKIITQSCEYYKKEYQEISEKYSQILGHNNMKQRLKHVSQLKDKIDTQQTEIFRLKQELELKNKSIELLKSNEKRVHSKGKENVQNSANTSKKSTLNRQTATPLSKNTTVVSSSSPHGPLRHRNE